MLRSAMAVEKNPDVIAQTENAGFNPRYASLSNVPQAFMLLIQVAAAARTTPRTCAPSRLVCALPLRRRLLLCAFPVFQVYVGEGLDEVLWAYEHANAQGGYTYIGYMAYFIIFHFLFGMMLSSLATARATARGVVRLPVGAPAR